MNISEQLAKLEQTGQPSSPLPSSNVDSIPINRVDPQAEQQFSQNREQRNGVQSDSVQDGEGGAANVEPEIQGTGIKEDG